jgi:hypothetical protein
MSSLPKLIKKHQEEIKACFDSKGTKIYSLKGIEEIFSSNWNQWYLPRNIRMNDLVEHFIKNSALKEVILKSPNYDKKYVRYAWGEISVYQLGLSLRPRSYLSHHSAIYLNNLADVRSRTIYVNSEQSPKFRGETSLEQRSIDLAFKAKKARTSKYIFIHKNWKICCLSGSNTNNLGVVEIEEPNSGTLQVTNIERTLIDITVRPFYSGGTDGVQKAYIKAKGKISTDLLISILRKINHVYPYHQAIGFYMQRAGFENSALNSLKKMGLEYDFYLDYGMVQTDYSKEWRVFFPRNLRAIR